MEISMSLIVVIEGTMYTLENEDKLRDLKVEEIKYLISETSRYLTTLKALQELIDERLVEVEGVTVEEHRSTVRDIESTKIKLGELLGIKA